MMRLLRINPNRIQNLLLIVFTACFIFQCQTTDPPPSETILKLNLNDSLKNYENISITLVDIVDTNIVLENIWSGPLPVPAQLPSHPLKAAKDKDFIVRIIGKASDGQIVMGTQIAYIGGKQTVSRPSIPPYQPRYSLKSLSAAGGVLLPAVNKVDSVYQLTFPEGQDSASLNIVPDFASAKIKVNGDSLAANFNSKFFRFGVKTDTVTVTITDASQSISYTKVYKVLLIPTIPYQPRYSLKSLSAAGGVLLPAVNKVDSVYQLTFPEGQDSASLNIVPDFASAKIKVNGDSLASNFNSKFFRFGVKTDTVTVTITDASQSISYTKVYKVLLIPTIPPPALLASLTPSGGVLSPDFTSYSLSYTLELPFLTDSVTFNFRAIDPIGSTLKFRGKSINDGETTPVIKMGLGIITPVQISVMRKGVENIYTIKIHRPNRP